MDTIGELSVKERAKREAKMEVDKENFEVAKEKLKTLYRKLESAKKVAKNIENEIVDLEIELTKDL